MRIRPVYKAIYRLSIYPDKECLMERAMDGGGPASFGEAAALAAAWDGEAVEGLGLGGLFVIQKKEGYRFGADTVRLAEYAFTDKAYDVCRGRRGRTGDGRDRPNGSRVSPGDGRGHGLAAEVSGGGQGHGRAVEVLDIGTGSGILILLLCGMASQALGRLGTPPEQAPPDCAAWHGCRYHGIEARGDVADMARRAMAANGLARMVGITHGDIRDWKRHYGKASFDMIVCNPPYYPVGGGRRAADEGKAAARSEVGCTFRDVAVSSGELLRPGGSLYVAHKPERLVELLLCMREYGIEPKGMRLAHHDAGKAASSVVVMGRKGGRPSLRVDGPFLAVGR